MCFWMSSCHTVAEERWQQKHQEIGRNCCFFDWFLHFCYYWGQDGTHFSILFTCSPRFRLRGGRCKSCEKDDANIRKNRVINTYLGGGNSNIFYFHPEPWGNDPIWRAYFSKGLKPPTSYSDVIFLEKTTLYLGLSPLQVTVANEGFPTKNAIILVVTDTGRGDNPIYTSSGLVDSAKFTPKEFWDQRYPATSPLFDGFYHEVPTFL